MPIFFLHDARVSGATPECDIAVRVNSGDYLRTVVEQLANRITNRYNEGAWFHTLHVLCHGLPQGLQLGTPFSTQHNVRTMFSPLRGVVGNIEIHGCRAAAIYNRGTPALGPYDGAAFCSELARTASANVSASDATQFYIPSSSITNRSGRNSLANWQGNVGIWNQSGRLAGVTSLEQRAIYQGTGSP
jgi:hypothetical protein